MRRWEYTTYEIGALTYETGEFVATPGLAPPGRAQEEFMDKLGKDGWELVSTLQAPATTGGSIRVHGIFKRRTD